MRWCAPFAKIRAELGDDAVVRAQLHDGHLPEARFGWEPLDELTLPEPTEVTHRPLVRRLYSPPIQLPPRARHEPDGWLIARFADGPVVEVTGRRGNRPAHCIGRMVDARNLTRLPLRPHAKRSLALDL
jgi:hypothetical protein